MPMICTPQTTPKGHRILRTASSGDVTAEDAAGLNRLIAPGAEFHGVPILGVIAPGANFSAEARSAFTSGGGTPSAKPAPVAVVVTSAPVRVMLSFIIRVSGASAYTRFFSAEAEALAWLDESLG